MSGIFPGTFRISIEKKDFDFFALARMAFLVSMSIVLRRLSPGMLFYKLGKIEENRIPLSVGIYSNGYAFSLLDPMV